MAKPANNRSMYDIEPLVMYEVGRRAFYAAQELDEAAQHFSASVTRGRAPVISRANRRARRDAKTLHAAATALRQQARQHMRAAEDAAREQGVRIA